MQNIQHQVHPPHGMSCEWALGVTAGSAPAMSCALYMFPSDRPAMTIPSPSIIGALQCASRQHEMPRCDEIWQHEMDGVCNILLYKTVPAKLKNVTETTCFRFNVQHVHNCTHSI